MKAEFIAPGLKRDYIHLKSSWIFLSDDETEDLKRQLPFTFFG